MPKTLTESDFKSAALWLEVPVAAVKAVATVESAGAGFLPDGRPKILFERHIMYRKLSEKLGKSKADALASQHPDIVNPKSGGYQGGSKEHDRLAQAVAIDRECALQSASWGGFQIMGFHWKTLGYASIQAFVNAMYKSEGEQLDAFSRFIKADPAMHRALKALDWAEFARRYNGPGYAANKYDIKMSQAYKAAGGGA
ncbi:N-acetylmuramidase family protein [Paraburkholderia aspalathi]|nr:N-acetylmuramidase family protein [Paraburkholderia aspalathi]